MADPFATHVELEARWRVLTEPERALADILLAEASAIIRSECPTIDDRLNADPPQLDPIIVIKVACGMVKRSMLADESPATSIGDASSIQQTAGPFSRSISYTSPTSGGVYLNKADRRLLGCSRQKAFMVDTLPYYAGCGMTGREIADLLNEARDD